MNPLVNKDNQIQQRIFSVRGQQVMIDRDLAELYEVEIRAINQAVKRNANRFPAHFCFQLSEEEWASLRSQTVTLKDTPANKRGQHRKYLPFVFTEQGVSMLSAVLRSESAIKTSILIMDAFVSMRRFMSQHALVFERMNAIERKQFNTDSKVEQILDALESKTIKQEQGIFYDGQIFEAYAFVSDLVRQAKKDIVLIDNYIDDTTLTLLSKNQDAQITLYTQKIDKQLALDIEKYNSQYQPLKVNTVKHVHDRFLIIDNQACYLIGASLKDLGKKVFGFSKLNIDTYKLIEGLHSWAKIKMCLSWDFQGLMGPGRQRNLEL